MTGGLLSRLGFIGAHTLRQPSFYPAYRRLMKNQWRSAEDLVRDQETQLRAMVSFAYVNVPYYRRVFRDRRLLPADIRTIEDLGKLPILTRAIIKRCPEAFVPATLRRTLHFRQATGGSTGVPLSFRVARRDAYLADLLLYRGWGHAGYRLGDPMAVLGGASLAIAPDPSLVARVKGSLLNQQKLSVFGPAEMARFLTSMRAFRPAFLRGYASSLYFFARWLEDEDRRAPPVRAVLTTAEKLYPAMRETLARVFGGEVFDGYGLNDGGVTAFECAEHAGLHIDTERSVLEVVDAAGRPVDAGEGRILATSLHNTAMPFLRYDTGDWGVLQDAPCSCGRGGRVLTEIAGRATDMLTAPDGQKIHGAALFNLVLHALAQAGRAELIDDIPALQIRQQDRAAIEIVLVGADELPGIGCAWITALINQQVPGWTVRFRTVATLDRTDGGKHRFIVSEVNE